MTAPAPAPASPRRARRFALGALAALLAATGYFLARPEREDVPAAGQVAPTGASPAASPAPPGSTAPAPTEDSGFFADFFKPRGEKPAPVAGIGGTEGGTEIGRASCRERV